MSGNIGASLGAPIAAAAGGGVRTDSGACAASGLRGCLSSSSVEGEAAATGALRKNRRLLLHVCCGPCAVMPLRRLLDEGYTVTAWFMNPNIHPLTEYLRRREAAGECAAQLGVPIVYADATWDVTAWLRAVAGRDAPPERCAWCCASRLEAAFAAAAALGCAWVSSSLLYSRYQPHAAIKAAGERLGAAGGPGFVYRDFREDWQEGIDRSKEMGLYRQPYCGCIYSEAERYGKRLARLCQEK